MSHAPPQGDRHKATGVLSAVQAARPRRNEGQVQQQGSKQQQGMEESEEHVHQGHATSGQKEFTTGMRTRQQEWRGDTQAKSDKGAGAGVVTGECGTLRVHERADKSAGEQDGAGPHAKRGNWQGAEGRVSGGARLGEGLCLRGGVLCAPAPATLRCRRSGRDTGVGRPVPVPVPVPRPLKRHPVFHALAHPLTLPCPHLPTLHPPYSRLHSLFFECAQHTLPHPLALLRVLKFMAIHSLLVALLTSLLVSNSVAYQISIFMTLLFVGNFVPITLISDSFLTPLHLIHSMVDLE